MKRTIRYNASLEDNNRDIKLNFLIGDDVLDGVQLFHDNDGNILASATLKEGIMHGESMVLMKSKDLNSDHDNNYVDIMEFVNGEMIKSEVYPIVGKDVYNRKEKRRETHFSNGILTMDSLFKNGLLVRRVIEKNGVLLSMEYVDGIMTSVTRKEVDGTSHFAVRKGGQPSGLFEYVVLDSKSECLLRIYYNLNGEKHVFKKNEYDYSTSAESTIIKYYKDGSIFSFGKTKKDGLMKIINREGLVYEHIEMNDDRTIKSYQINSPKVAILSVDGLITVFTSSTIYQSKYYKKLNWFNRLKMRLYGLNADEISKHITSIPDRIMKEQTKYSSRVNDFMSILETEHLDIDKLTKL